MCFFAASNVPKVMPKAGTTAKRGADTPAYKPRNPSARKMERNMPSVDVDGDGDGAAVTGEDDESSWNGRRTEAEPLVVAPEAYGSSRANDGGDGAGRHCCRTLIRSSGWPTHTLQKPALNKRPKNNNSNETSKKG